jgi:CHAT domain-containing protein
MTTWKNWQKVLPALVVSYLLLTPSAPVMAQAASIEFHQSTIDEWLQRGMNELTQGNLSSGNQLIQNALQQYRRQHDLQGESRALRQLSEFYLSQKDHKTAIDYAKQNLVIKQGINDRQGIANALNNFGLIYQSWHRYQSAISYQQQSLKYYRETQDLAAQGTILHRLGNNYYLLGNYPKALEYHEQSLTIRRQISDQNSITESLNSLGKTHQALEEPEKAIAFYEQSLTIAQTQKNLTTQSHILGNIGNLYEFSNQLDSAIAYYDKSLTIAQKTQDFASVAQAFSNRANAYLRQGNITKAIAYQQKNLDIQRSRLSSEYGQAIAYHHLGRYYLQANHLDEAAKYLRQAIYAGEALRIGLSDANKVAFAETQSDSYKLLQKVLIKQNQIKFALEIAERARARSFADRLSYRSRFAPGSNEPQTDETRANPMSANSILGTALRQNATIVQYSIVDRELYIWVIKADGTHGTIAFEAVDLEHFNIPIEKLVANSRRAIGVRSAIKDQTKSNPLDLDQQLQQLHKILIAPIAQHLPSDPNQRVIFIPQDSLFLVPFAALKNDQGKYLIEQHTISTAPSIQTLAFTATKREQRRWLQKQNNAAALIVGNPTMPKLDDLQLEPLPYAEQEANTIAQIIGSTALTGRQATKATVLDRISQAEIIHFATHGLFEYLNENIPGAITFTPDPNDTNTNDNGFLTAREIIDLQLKANLVVLSACDTGRGRITGDGVIGLSRSFLIAGTPSIVVSLWAVNDRSTASFMGEFYRQFNQPSTNKAQALRQAMLNTMQQYPNPIDWAAFTLIGEAE